MTNQIDAFKSNLKINELSRYKVIVSKDKLSIMNRETTLIKLL